MAIAQSMQDQHPSSAIRGQGRSEGDLAAKGGGGGYDEDAALAQAIAQSLQEQEKNVGCVCLCVCVCVYVCVCVCVRMHVCIFHHAPTYHARTYVHHINIYINV